MERLQHFYNNNIMTDIELTICDNLHEITIELHKLILSINSIYFEKMFTNFLESKLSKIRIEVPNAIICYNIIMSFYGIYTHNDNLNGIAEDNKPKWQYELEKIKCCDFLEVEYDYKLLNDIDFPENACALLIDVARIIGSKNHYIIDIIYNVCQKYNFMEIDDILRNKIIDKYDNDILFTVGVDETIHYCESYKSDIKLFNKTNYAVHCICVSNDKRYLACCGTKNVYIYDIQSKDITNNINNFDKLNCLLYTNDDNIIISDFDTLKLWDIKNNKLIKNLKNNYKTRQLISSNDKRYIYTIDTNGLLCVFDANTIELINETIITTDEYYIYYQHIIYTLASIGDFIITAKDKYLTLRNPITGTIKKKFYSNQSVVTSIVVSNDNQTFITGSFDGTIRIWNINQRNFIKKINAHEQIVTKIIYSSNYKNIISVAWDNKIKIWIPIINSESKTLVTLELFNEFDNCDKFGLIDVCSIPCQNTYINKLKTNLSKKIELTFI